MPETYNINLNNVESTNNKSSDVNADQTSNTKYATIKAIFDWATGLFLKKSNNLSDISNAASARTNLGLGDSAIKNVGTATGTVAAGDRAANSFSGYQGYALTGGTSGSITPVNATTYYIGVTTSVPITFAGRRKIYILKSGTAVKIAISFINASTAGTNELSSVYFRLNNTTDTLIDSNIDLSNVAGYWTGVVTINVPVAEGDFFEIKWITTTWVTRPANVQVYWELYIE